MTIDVQLFDPLLNDLPAAHTIDVMTVAKSGTRHSVQRSGAFGLGNGVSLPTVQGVGVEVYLDDQLIGAYAACTLTNLNAAVQGSTARSRINIVLYPKPISFPAVKVRATTSRQIANHVDQMVQRGQWSGDQARGVLSQVHAAHRALMHTHWDPIEQHRVDRWLSELSDWGIALLT